MDYNFINPGNTNAFTDDQVVLDQCDNELKQVCPHCLLVTRYPLFLKCKHLTCLPCLREYQRHSLMFENIIPCPICQQSCRLDKIYSFKVEKKNRPNSI